MPACIPARRSRPPGSSIPAALAAEGIATFDPWHLPLVNTLILLTSGTTVTWAHHALQHNDRDGLKWGLICTVILGALFTCVQAYEYAHAGFGFSENIYGATFFMATGFHGFHVLIGTIFLTVCLFRALAGHFKPEQHFGFEAAAWYWHFVDVVWLFLFACIYVWGCRHTGGALTGLMPAAGEAAGRVRNQGRARGENALLRTRISAVRGRSRALSALRRGQSCSMVF